MPRIKTVVRVVPVTLLALALYPANEGYAQIQEVSPNGALANPVPQPSNSPIVVSVPGQGGAAQGAEPGEGGDSESGGQYYYDAGKPRGRTSGVPETHTVNEGDTLWDISGDYFGNPWSWPKVWSYNAQITNPHWIYPGDKVRLRKAGSGNAIAKNIPLDIDGGKALRSEAADTRARMVFRQLAFVSKGKKDYAGSIAGSVEGKTLLATGETVYLDYKGGQAPKPGQKYAVYQNKKDVVDPSTGNTMGSLVRVVGEVEVRSVKKDKRARAVITDTTRVIERGLLVGPVIQQFRDLKETPNERNLEGRIVERLEGDKLIGQQVAVLLNIGASSGMKVGNRLYAVRRGDEYTAPGSAQSTVGLDDDRFPARAVGELIVAEVSKNTALALVTASSQELEIGELIIMRRSK